MTVSELCLKQSPKDNVPLKSTAITTIVHIDQSPKDNVPLKSTAIATIVHIDQVPRHPSPSRVAQGTMSAGNTQLDTAQALMKLEANCQGLHATFEGGDEETCVGQVRKSRNVPVRLCEHHYHCDHVQCEYLQQQDNLLAARHL